MTIKELKEKYITNTKGTEKGKKQFTEVEVTHMLKEAIASTRTDAYTDFEEVLKGYDPKKEDDAGGEEDSSSENVKALLKDVLKPEVKEV